MLRKFGNRVDLFVYIGMTAIKRVLALRETGRMIHSYLNDVYDIKRDFLNKLHIKRSGAWIREPIPSDPWRWTVLASFGSMPPRNDWNKQGFVKMGSKQADKALNYYIGLPEAS